MENPRTKAKRARKQRKEKEEERAATGPGHPARPPEIRRPSQKTPEAEPSQPGHPAPGPDIRPVARTSSPSRLCAAHPGRVPCTPSSLRLYILAHLLQVRVSIGLAHICVRALLIHLVTSPRRSRPLRRRSPKQIQDPFLAKNIKTSVRRRMVPLYPYLC